MWRANCRAIELREDVHVGGEWVADIDRARNHGVRPFHALRVACPALCTNWFRRGNSTGSAFTGDVGTTAVALGIAGAAILGAGSYALESCRRVLPGVSGGVLFGLSVAAAFGLDGWLDGFFGRVLALVCGAVGGILVPRFFDMFVIGASAVGGAAVVMTGANHIFPGVRVFNPAAGGVLPSLVTIILAVAGVSWQRSNITKVGSSGARGSRRLRCFGQANMIGMDLVAIPAATSEIRLLTTGVDSK